MNGTLLPACFQPMLGGLSTIELEAMIVVAATEFAARQRQTPLIGEHVDAGAGVELLVELQPPGVHFLLVDSDGRRHMLSTGALKSDYT